MGDALGADLSCGQLEYLGLKRGHALLASAAMPSGTRAAPPPKEEAPVPTFDFGPSRRRRGPEALPLPADDALPLFAFVPVAAEAESPTAAAAADEEAEAARPKKEPAESKPKPAGLRPPRDRQPRVATAPPPHLPPLNRSARGDAMCFGAGS